MKGNRKILVSKFTNPAGLIVGTPAIPGINMVEVVKVEKKGKMTK